jgi:hypothetical protein
MIGQVAKDSHNSSLPPSSDRFVRPPKSLRQPSGQKGHRGLHLRQIATPDEVLIHFVEQCEPCQHNLRAHPAEIAERRQVIGSPCQAASGHRTSGRRKVMSDLLPSHASGLSDRGEGSSTVWEKHPDAGNLFGRDPISSLCSCQSTLAGTAGSPALSGQHRHICQNMSPAVG